MTGFLLPPTSPASTCHPGWQAIHKRLLNGLATFFLNVTTTHAVALIPTKSTPPNTPPTFATILVRPSLLYSWGATMVTSAAMGGCPRSPIEAAGQWGAGHPWQACVLWGARHGLTQLATLSLHLPQDLQTWSLSPSHNPTSAQPSPFWKTHPWIPPFPVPSSQPHRPPPS
jgi:hypothetical protein